MNYPTNKAERIYRTKTVRFSPVDSAGGRTREFDIGEMRYSASGRLGMKTREWNSVSGGGNQMMEYGYPGNAPADRPHAPRLVEDHAVGNLYGLEWDAAGNLGQLSTLDEHSGEVRSRFLLWTEDSRLHTVVDDRHHSYYAYDHAGGSCGSRAQSQACLSYAEMQQRRRSQRTMKVTGHSHQLDVNADLMHTAAGLDEFTLYPSPYLVFTNRGYTKHYYAGSERLAARIGGGFDRPILREQTGIAMTATHLFKQSQHNSNERHLNAPPAHTIRRDHLSENIYMAMMREFEIPMHLVTDAVIKSNNLISTAQNIVAGNAESNVYFYHSDHLGSASWITEAGGKPVQHIQYLPYGEPFLNQRVSGYNERFTFTGKERDEETGYSYFGARYMDHELMTMWLSVDPLADKYPNISPYAYCMWNPIKLVDPDGREVINRHTKNIENLKKEIADLEDQIKTCTGSKLERLNRKLVNKQKSLKEEMKYEKIVGNAIQDLKDYGGDEFEKLDQLTDIKGNKVDVYIQMEGYIEKIGGPEGKTYGTIHPDGSCSSEMGENTMLVSLSHKYRDVAGKVLAHEGGHVLFDVKLPHVLNGFYSSHPSAKRNGHDQDNPSGKWANAYENRYEENRRRAIK